MTPNEAREKLDMNPDIDPASDKLRIPSNIVGKNSKNEDQNENVNENDNWLYFQLR